MDYTNLRDKTMAYPNLRHLPKCPLCGEPKHFGPVVCPRCHEIHDLRHGLLPSIQKVLATAELDAGADLWRML